jgi:hypothetical protein
MVSTVRVNGGAEPWLCLDSRLLLNQLPRKLGGTYFFFFWTACLEPKLSCPYSHYLMSSTTITNIKRYSCMLLCSAQSPWSFVFSGFVLLQCTVAHVI